MSEILISGDPGPETPLITKTKGQMCSAEQYVLKFLSGSDRPYTNPYTAHLALQGKRTDHKRTGTMLSYDLSKVFKNCFL